MPAIRADDAVFVVELERFQGPLDLLLHLIREQDIDIFDIPIARITQQFLGAVRGVESLGLDRAGHFLELAATLVRIKVQMLLPRRSDEAGEWVDPRAELVQRLLEYEHFRDAATQLEMLERDRQRSYRRGHVPPRPERPVDEAPLDVSWSDVWAAALDLDQRAQAPADHTLPRRVVTLEAKVGLILDKLSRLARIEFRELITPFRDRLHSVATFMAGLELARRREVTLRQREPFAPLWFYRRNGKRGNGHHPDS